MTPVPSSTNRLLAATLIDWIGTGFYLALSAIFLTRSAGLEPSEVGLVLAVAGLVAFFGAVHVGRLGDRIGPRQVLLVLYVMRAAAFVGLTIVHDLGVTLVMLSVIALGDQAASSMYQALANMMVSKDERVGLMARMRVVINIGITLGTVPAGIALATQGNSFAALLLGNAASYLLAGLIVATLPADTSLAAPETRRRLLIPSPATAAMISINGLMSLWVVILNVGLPLWIVDATAAPRALVAVLYGTSTVVAISAQARVARWVNSYLRAARAQRLAGVLLALCCGCLAGSALVGSAASTILLVAGVLCLSGGELLTVSSAWEVSFRLAPPGRSAEFFATYGLGRAGSQVAGPILITVAVLALGVPGWLALAGLFIIGGFITPLMAQRALDHPLVLRKPPAGPPSTAGCCGRLLRLAGGPGGRFRCCGLVIPRWVTMAPDPAGPDPACWCRRNGAFMITEPRQRYSLTGFRDHETGAVSRRLPQAPAKVWRALTEPEHLEAWFPTTIDGERAAGAKLSFAFRDLDMPPMDGQMLVYDPPALLELTWSDELLRFELSPDGDGTLLRFTASFDELGRAARDGAGWHSCLDLLAFDLSGEAPPWGPGERWRQVHPGYVERFGPETATIGPPQEWEDVHGPAE